MSMTREQLNAWLATEVEEWAENGTVQGKAVVVNTDAILPEPVPDAGPAETWEPEPVPDAPNGVAHPDTDDQPYYNPAWDTLAYEDAEDTTAAPPPPTPTASPPTAPVAQGDAPGSSVEPVLTVVPAWPGYLRDLCLYRVAVQTVATAHGALPQDARPSRQHPRWLAMWHALETAFHAHNSADLAVVADAFLGASALWLRGQLPE